jgi:hypothetical protein
MELLAGWLVRDVLTRSNVGAGNQAIQIIQSFVTGAGRAGAE